MTHSDVARFKDRARHTWAQGDYSETAQRLEPASERLVAALGVTEAHRVLDVAAGTGNAALFAAHTGAIVTASDLVPRMVELGQARTRAAGLDVQWVEADCEELPFGDGAFDAAMSVFGVIFAPRPEVAARELCRVVRAGGRVGLTVWTPESYTGRVLAAIEEFMPGPEGVPPQSEWGRAEVMAARFGDLVEDLVCTTEELSWDFDSVDDMLEKMLDTAPPVVAARERLSERDFERLAEQLRKIVMEYSHESSGGIELTLAYTQAIAKRSDTPVPPDRRDGGLEPAPTA